MSDLLIGFDSIDVSQFGFIPKIDFLMGYVTPSSWPDYGLECVRYPELAKQHRIASISPSVEDDADGIDCEIGDAPPGDNAAIVAWLQRQLDRGVWRPFPYASSSTWLDDGLLAAVAHFGDKIRRMPASWTFKQAIDFGWADIQQISDSWDGHNVDCDVALLSAFPSAPQPTPANLLHLDWFDTEKRFTPHGRISERDLASRYDGAREHPDQNKDLLRVLESQCRWLSDRINVVARHLEPLPNHKPSWGVDHRGWRRIRLARMAQGQRFI